MAGKIFVAWFCILRFTASVVAQSAGDDRVDRFSEKVRQDMTGLPNYTCLETIVRTRREPHARSFQSADRIRLEVSSVGGKELFAWPGSRRFEDREVTELVTGGAMGSGMFATFAQRLFVERSGGWEFAGEETVEGRAAVRCDYRLTPQQSKMRVKSNAVSETVGVRGSFWFDPASLDLIRIEAHADGLPASVNLQSAEFRTDYARVRIGKSVPLLPKQSVLTVTEVSGEADRNQIDFSGCREYASESTISFDMPANVSEAPKPAVREVDLPPGLMLRVELDEPIDSKTASTGDVLHAHVAREVSYQGGVVPRGAAVTGNLCKLERNAKAERVAVCIRFSEIEWEGAHAAFQAELVDLSRRSAGAHWPLASNDGRESKAAIERRPSGAGIFFMDGARFRIAKGFHMVWRTLPRAAGVP